MTYHSLPFFLCLLLTELHTLEIAILLYLPHSISFLVTLAYNASYHLLDFYPFFPVYPPIREFMCIQLSLLLHFPDMRPFPILISKHLWNGLCDLCSPVFRVCTFSLF